ncbi:hypothetical protein [Lactobacillus delbrueckii]|uniref:hypothetical protein n=2 Tax=Lactobacillus delbrueckii TaxID=1584 RepID=UPI0037C67E2B
MKLGGQETLTLKRTKDEADLDVKISLPDLVNLDKTATDKANEELKIDKAEEAVKEVAASEKEGRHLLLHFAKGQSQLKLSLDPGRYYIRELTKPGVTVQPLLLSLPRNGSNQLTVYLKTEAVTGQVQLTKLGYASASAKGKALAGVSFYLYLEGNSLPLRVDALGKLSTDDRDSRLLFTDLKKRGTSSTSTIWVRPWPTRWTRLRLSSQPRSTSSRLSRARTSAP